MRLQQAYLSSTITGTATALAFAFVSLMVFVSNYVVALLAFASICSVVCCTLGGMAMLGWKLGTIEAICSAIVVGFSVDYVVHYALAFVNAPTDRRDERVVHAFQEVGISILAGALTTMFASCFLLMTTVQCALRTGWERGEGLRCSPHGPARYRFFFKFGVFVMGTIFFSLVIANFLFMSLVATLGPSGKFGDLSCICQALKPKRRRKDAVGPEADSTPTAA